MRKLDECKEEVFRRMEKETKEKKLKRKFILTSCISICVIAVLSCFLFNNIFLKQSTAIAVEKSVVEYTSTIHPPTEEDNVPLSTDSPTTSDEDVVSDTDNGHNATAGTSENTKTFDTKNQEFTNIFFNIKVNKIINKANGKKQYYDPALYKKTTLTEKEANDYLGLDFSALNLASDYKGVIVKNLIINNSGKTVYDTFTISFGDNITILTSKVGLPNDCIYQLDKTYASTFYNVKNLSYPQTTVIIGTDGNGFYYADFNIGSINYRVTIKNCYNLEKFGFILKSIIDLSIE